MTVADLDEDDVYTQCPRCTRQVFHLGYNVLLQVRAEPRRFPLCDATPVTDYVSKHVCRACSRPGRPVRAQGWIQPCHRSGAEGYRQRPELDGLIEF
jgi:NMD protein affecting ribosome stability and mRNA decay